MKPPPIRRRQGGFAYIAAVILLVVMAGMAIAVVRLNLSQANAATGAALAARAGQAARAGVEWSVNQLLNKNAVGCTSDNLTDFQADTGFKVSVTCTYTAYNEGLDAGGQPIVKNLYQIVSVACNGSGNACPEDASSMQPDYVERRRVATVCMLAAGGDCY